jgi:hypothetical protein
MSDNFFHLTQRDRNDDAGVRGIVFDKDNTLTAPYVDTPHDTVAAAFDQCKDVFGPSRVVILSNSAGTPDDPGKHPLPTLGPPVKLTRTCWQAS